MKRLWWTLLLVSCSGSPQPMSWTDLPRSKEFKGKQVVIEGYPGVLVPATHSHKGEQDFFLLDQAVGVTSSASASVPVVAAVPKWVEQLPDPYTAKDLLLHCEGGQTAGFKDKVRITGKMEWVYGPNIRISKIEKLPSSQTQ